MLLSRWWSFFLGYLIVKVEGEFIEKLLNMANSRGIILWDIIPLSENKIKIKVRIHGFKVLRHIARKQHCKIKIQGKRGLPFLLARLGKRKMLVVGAIGFSVILYLLSSFVWFIEIKGGERVKPEQLLTVAQGEGLRIGAGKWEFDPKKIEKAISDLPQIAWVGIQVKGTKVTIEIAEKVLPDVTADETIPAHLIASKDGLVHEMLVLAGVAAVKQGDTVQKGQVLISGYFYPNVSADPNVSTGDPEISLGKLQEIRAKGIVRARVWYEETVRVLLEEHGYNKTGNFIETVGLKVLNKEMIIRGPKQVPYTKFTTNVERKSLPQWRNIVIPVEITYKIYYELEEYHRSFSREEALQLATKEAKGRISLHLPNDAKIANTQITELTAEENSLQIRLTVETIEDITTPYAILQK